MKSNPFEDAIARVRDRLGCLGSTVVYHPTIGSTNDVAADLANRAVATGAQDIARPELVEGRASARGSTSSPRAGEPNVPQAVEGLVVVADEQTAGRGRRGHTWFSPPGSGLYVSVVLAPGRARSDPVRATTLLTLAAGVAVAEGVQVASALGVDLKWPNDLFVGRRKLAGILAEKTADDFIVLGYGINVGPMAYPLEIADRATSLETELGRAVDRHLLFAETLTALARRYDDLLAGRFDAILDAWRRRAPSATGARVQWAEQSGTTAGIDEQGALLVRTGDRVERIVSGKVIWS